jgi:hypothetical protein
LSLSLAFNLSFGCLLLDWSTAAPSLINVSRLHSVS